MLIKNIKLIIFLLICFIFIGCAKNNFYSCKCKHNHCNLKLNKTILTATHISQDPVYYANQIKLSKVDSHEIVLRQKQFKNRYYDLWLTKKYLDKLDPNEPYVGIDLKKEWYGANLEKYSAEEIEALKKNANNKYYNSIGKSGIMVKSADLRGLPTDYPFFRSPDNYPFDQIQNSIIYLGTPVYISHYSKDGAWIYIVAPNRLMGWVKSDMVGKVSSHQMKMILTKKIATFYVDNYPIHDNVGKFLFYSKIGMHLPLVIAKGDTVRVYFPKINEQSNVTFIELNIKRKIISPKPLRFTKQNIIYLLKQLLNKPYGWGNYLGYRDCSSFIKDFYSVFHFFMPRNSRDQIDSLEKHELICNKEFDGLKYAKPFLTIFYMKGHIGIYAGDFQGDPVIVHQVAWGAMSKTVRAIGHIKGSNTFFSPLYYDKEGSLIIYKNPTFLTFEEYGSILKYKEKLRTK